MASASWLFIVPCLFTMAGLFDVLTTRIPNWISITLVLLFLPFSALSGYPLHAIGSHALAGVIVFALGFLAFSLGWMGGGDGKLAAAGALWFGPTLAPQFITLSFIFGGALVGLVAVMRMSALSPYFSQHAWLSQWMEGKEGLPFGLAMAAAVLTLIPQQTQLLTF